MYNDTRAMHTPDNADNDLYIEIKVIYPPDNTDNEVSAEKFIFLYFP